MTFGLRVLTVALAAFSLTAVVSSLLVLMLSVRKGPADPASRARRLTFLRLLPSGVAVLVGLMVAASFLIYESRKTEYIGWVIPAVAAFGALLFVAAIWRAIRIAFATRRLTRDWLTGAEPIALRGITVPSVVVNTSFPVVAVIGVRRPTLVIARSVLELCTPEELDAILAHEQGHIEHRDNLRRTVLAVMPDLFGWLPPAARLVTAWRAACEEAADDEAARTGANGRLFLASALVKVARMAAGARISPAMPASSFYCGENLDTRVRRLLQPGGVVTAGKRGFLAAAGIVAGLAVVLVVSLEALQETVEFAIHITR